MHSDFASCARCDRTEVSVDSIPLSIRADAIVIEMRIAPAAAVYSASACVSASQVEGPTIASTTSPLSDWNALTADCVSSP